MPLAVDWLIAALVERTWSQSLFNDHGLPPPTCSQTDRQTDSPVNLRGNLQTALYRIESHPIEHRMALKMESVQSGCWLNRVLKISHPHPSSFNWKPIKCDWRRLIISHSSIYAYWLLIMPSCHPSPSPATDSHCVCWRMDQSGRSCPFIDWLASSSPNHAVERGTRPWLVTFVTGTPSYPPVSCPK